MKYTCREGGLRLPGATPLREKRVYERKTAGLSLMPKKKDRNGRPFVFVFSSSRRRSGPQLDAASHICEEEGGRGVPKSLPHSGILFLLGAYPKSPDRFATTRRSGKGNTGEEGAHPHRAPRIGTDELQSRESGIQRHDRGPVFNCVHKCNTWGKRNARNALYTTLSALSHVLQTMDYGLVPLV